jgi:hypothetical protein
MMYSAKHSNIAPVQQQEPIQLTVPPTPNFRPANVHLYLHQMTISYIFLDVSGVVSGDAVYAEPVAITVASSF